MDLPTAFARALPASDWPRAAHTGVLIGLVETREWQPWFADAYALIDARERARAERQRRAQDRETLVLAYAMHRLLLGQVLRVAPAEVQLGRDDLGCPRLADGAAHTSLSHAQGWVAVAIAVGGPVGIDLEPAARASELPEIAARICHTSETAALAGLPAEARARALLALWVRKEAFLKAEGIGLAREMADFPAADGDLLPLASVPGGQARVRMVEAGAQCVVAVAGPPDAVVHSAWIRPTT
jgi:4'-phosphopantetheinyl transferase